MFIWVGSDCLRFGEATHRSPHFLLFLSAPLNGVNQGNAPTPARSFFAMPRATGQPSPDDKWGSFASLR